MSHRGGRGHRGGGGGRGHHNHNSAPSNLSGGPGFGTSGKQQF